MLGAWYQTGTAALVNGSTAVTGTGTLWASQVQVGSIFTTDNDRMYMVAAVTDNNHITIWPPYLGATAPAASYSIIRNFSGTTNAAIAAQVANFVERVSGRDDEFTAWLSGAPDGGPSGDGKYPLTDITGFTRMVESPSRLLQLLDDGVADNAAQIIERIEDDVATAHNAATLAAAAAVSINASIAVIGSAMVQATNAAATATTAAASAADILALTTQAAASAALSASQGWGYGTRAEAAAHTATQAAGDILILSTSLYTARDAATVAAGTATSAAARSAADVIAITTLAAAANLDAAHADNARIDSEAARETAKAWAAAPTGLPVEIVNGTSYFSARHHSALAQTAAQTATDKAAGLTAAVNAATDQASLAGNRATQAGDSAYAAEQSRLASEAAQGQAETAAEGAQAIFTQAAEKIQEAQTAITAATEQVALATQAANTVSSAVTNTQNAAAAAAGSATDALNAKTDAVNARDLTNGYMGQTLTYRADAQAWAASPIGVPVPSAPGFFSALHWADQARQYTEQAAAIVGGNGFGIIGDGTSQRLVAQSPSSLLNLIALQGVQAVYNQATLSVTLKGNASTLPFSATGALTADNVADALVQLEQLIANFSTDKIHNGGGSVTVEGDGAVVLVTPPGADATLNGRVLHTSANAYSKGEIDALFAASTTVVPAGQIIPYSGSGLPANTLDCDGAAYEPEQYPILFDTIGFTYGQDGTKFKVPNLNGRVPMGVSPNGVAATRATTTLNTSAPITLSSPYPGSAFNGRSITVVVAPGTAQSASSVSVVLSGTLGNVTLTLTPNSSSGQTLTLVQLATLINKGSLTYTPDGVNVSLSNIVTGGSGMAIREMIGVASGGDATPLTSGQEFTATFAGGRIGSATPFSEIGDVGGSAEPPALNLPVRTVVPPGVSQLTAGQTGYLTNATASTGPTNLLRGPYGTTAPFPEIDMALLPVFKTDGTPTSGDGGNLPPYLAIRYIITIGTSGAGLANPDDLATVARTGNYIDLTGRPALKVVATSGSYDDLDNRPSLATVATSGNYNDLTGRPDLSLASVAQAGKLTTPRTITLTGGATGSVAFDGSADVSLGVTVASVPATALAGTISADRLPPIAEAGKLTTPRTIALTGDVIGSVSFDGSANATLAATVASVPATAITGVIPLANMNPAAIERMQPVANDAARFALTIAEVQNGDTVKVGSVGDGAGNGKLYLVVDDTHLNSEAGYTPYTAGIASAVDWSGIQNKPTTLAGSGITDVYTKTETDTTLSAKASTNLANVSNADFASKATAAGIGDTAASANSLARRDATGGLTASGLLVRGESHTGAATIKLRTGAENTDNGSWGITATGNQLSHVLLDADGDISSQQWLNVSRLGTSILAIDFKQAPTVNGIPLVSGSGSSITQLAPTYVPGGSSTTLEGKSVVAVYEQIAGQTFDLTYNTESDYAQESAAKTDLTGGAFTLANTGGALTDANTKLLIHADGVNGSTEIVDSRGITPFGMESCGYFDGTTNNSYYLVPQSSKLAFGTTQDFTVEAWIRPASGLPLHNTGLGVPFDCRNSASAGVNGVECYYNYNNQRFYFGTTDTVVNVPAPIDQWNHVAYVRRAGTMKVYVNGVEGYSAANALDYQAQRIILGCYTVLGNYPFAGWLSNFRVSKIARYTGNFTPPTSAFVTDEHTVHLLKFNDGHGSQMLRDESRSGHEVVANDGSASITSARAKFGITSWNGKFLVSQTKAHEDFNLGNQDFTLDFWYHPTAFVPDTLLGFNHSGYYPAIVVNSTSGALNVGWSTANNQASYTTQPCGSLTLNAWNHIAWTRSGADMRVFVNGVMHGPFNVGTSTIVHAASKLMGYQSTNGNCGQYDEVRVKRGVAEWTTNFTPPTAPYVADDRTILLLHFDGVNGDKVTLDSSESSYSGSGFSDTTMPTLNFSSTGSLTAARTRGGHGTSLALTSTTASTLLGTEIPTEAKGHPLYFSNYFCMEAWAYFDGTTTSYVCSLWSTANADNTQTFLQFSSDGTAKVQYRLPSGTNSISKAVTVGWHHLAFVYEPRGYVFYVDGVAAAAPVNAGVPLYYHNTTYKFGLARPHEVTAPTPLTIDSLRISNGKPRYTTNFTPSNLTQDTDTALLWVFDGSVGQKWVKELSKNTATVPATNARMVRDGRWIAPAALMSLVTSEGSITPKFGSAMLSNGHGSAMAELPLPELAFGTGPFTVECWYNGLINGLRPLLSGGADSSNYWWLGLSGGVFTIGRTGLPNMAGGAVSNNAWTHLAWVREGIGTNQTKLYVNGVMVLSTTDAMNYAYTKLRLMKDFATSAADGFLDEVRISNVARWTANFIPPTLPYGQQYVTGPAWVATKPGSTALDLSAFESIDHGAFAGSVPPGTTLKFLASFDGYASPLRRWNGSAWVATAHSMTWSGGSLTTTATAAQLDSVANTWLEFQTGLTAWTPPLGSAVNLVAVLASTNPQFTPSLDNIGVTMDEYTMLQPVADYAVSRKRASGAQTLTFKRVKAGNALHVFDCVG